MNGARSENLQKTAMLFRITHTKTQTSQTAVNFREPIPYVFYPPAQILVYSDGNNLLGERIYTTKLKHRKIINRQ